MLPVQGGQDSGYQSIMGFKDRFKQVFSTGQASAIDEARRLHKGGDITGAVSRLREALEART